MILLLLTCSVKFNLLSYKDLTPGIIADSPVSDTLLKSIKTINDLLCLFGWSRCFHTSLVLTLLVKHFKAG